MKIDLLDGKYTYIVTPDGAASALRHGEPWRDLCGDKFVYAMACEIEAARSSESVAHGNFAMVLRQRDDLIEALNTVKGIAMRHPHAVDACGEVARDALSAIHTDKHVADPRDEALEKAQTALELESDAIEALMRWCVKNVDRWDFPQYDSLSYAVEKRRDALATISKIQGGPL